MPRQDSESQKKYGLLSPTTLAVLLGRSQNTIRKWLDKGFLEKLVTPGQKDIRISAHSALLFVIKYKLPFNSELIQAAKNYAMMYEPDLLPKIVEIESKMPSNSIANLDPTQVKMAAWQPIIPKNSETATP